MSSLNFTETEKTANIPKKQVIGFGGKDRLGSTVAVFDHEGKLKEAHSFDPFGKARKSRDSLKADTTLSSAFSTRGFTDHEHMDNIQMIHMNGRGYDYNLGRFLSVDPFIVDPGNSQALNPYTYVLNNPLSGTDPSGYTACKTGSRIGCGGATRKSNTPTRIVGKTSGGRLVVSNGGENKALSHHQTKKVLGQVGSAAGGSTGINSNANRQNTAVAAGGGAIGVGGGVEVAAPSVSKLGVAGLAASLTSSSYEDPEDNITVYRGTNLTSEIQVHAETGVIMSEEARRFYQGTTTEQFYKNGTVTNKETLKAVGLAGVRATQKHASLVAKYGGEASLATAQTKMGQNFPVKPRTMFSVTTSYNVAKYFSRGGAIFSAKVSRHSLIKTPVKSSTESEYFIRAQIRMSREF